MYIIDAQLILGNVDLNHSNTRMIKSKKTQNPTIQYDLPITNIPPNLFYHSYCLYRFYIMAELFQCHYFQGLSLLDLCIRSEYFQIHMNLAMTELWFSQFLVPAEEISVHSLALLTFPSFLELNLVHRKFRCQLGSVNRDLELHSL